VQELISSPTTSHIPIAVLHVQEDRPKLQAPAPLEEHAQIAFLNVILVLRATTVHRQVADAFTALLVLFKLDMERIFASLAH